MKKLLILILLLIMTFGLFSCGNNEDGPNEDNQSGDAEVVDKYRTYYQLLIYSFADGNGDGIGDFKGIIDKLDYLENLGIKGIWLSPFNKAASYHSYDVNNYYSVNGKYVVEENGVTYGIEKLLEECHKRDINVIMDLVLNHTSYSNKWYSEHRDWYSKDNKFGFPELNYDLQEVREAVKEVGYYWLDKGMDGFRLDAAMWIYNSGSDQHTKNYSFWTEWTTAMRNHKKDCYIIAEVLDSNSSLVYTYAKGGFDSTFDFNAISSLIQFVKGTSRTYVDVVSLGMANVANYNKDYILARTLSNHDIGRFTDVNESKKYVSTKWQIILGNLINALTPGNTFVYYGDELGLKGTAPSGYNDMAYRTPMPFATERTDSTKYFYNVPGGSTTSETFSGNSAEADMADPNSIYNQLRKALSLKNNNDVFKKGIMDSIEDLPASLYGYSLYLDGRLIYVIFNPFENASSYEFKGDILLSSLDNIEGTNITLNQGDYVVIDVK